MADVQRGDVLVVTSGDYSGEAFRVVDTDVNTAYASLTSLSWLRSRCTVQRPAEDTVNLDGQTEEGLSDVAADVPCDIQMPRSGQGGEKEAGWGQRPDQVRKFFFDDRTVTAELVDEPALEE